MVPPFRNLPHTQGHGDLHFVYPTHARLGRLELKFIIIGFRFPLVPRLATCCFEKFSSLSGFELRGLKGPDSRPKRQNMNGGVIDKLAFCSENSVPRVHKTH